MKKSDLKTGMVVELLNGNKYVVMIDTCMGDFPEILLDLDEHGYIGMEVLNNDMKCESDCAFSVKKVYAPFSPSCLIEGIGYDLLWEDGNDYFFDRV